MEIAGGAFTQTSVTTGMMLHLTTTMCSIQILHIWRYAVGATKSKMQKTELSIQDPTDVKGLEKYALKKLLDLDIRYLNLYVTGLTVALIASLNACKKLDIKVTLWHFDRETDTYFSQEVCR